RSLRARGPRFLRARACRVSRARGRGARTHKNCRRGAAARRRAERDRRASRRRAGRGGRVMTDAPESPQRLLATRLCPWLEQPLQRIEAARTSGRLGHAWLIVGPRGMGKINLARVVAERLLTSPA